uniref:Epithelial cell transforming 2 like n=1 Tax=Oncorhynchus tshawytscha TaxID=74940 RepID=A0AAZ3S1J6_ONCTS
MTSVDLTVRSSPGPNPGPHSVTQWQLSGTDYQPQSALMHRSSFTGTADNRFSAWTPITNKTTNHQLFEERTTLVLHWFDLWTDRQRKLFLQALLSQCTRSQLKDWLMQIVPVTRVDFTSVLPRFLSLYVMSFLTPRDLCSAAQVSWHWRVLAEQDCLWSARCVRRGWFLPYNPGDREYGGWKSHYVSCVSTLDWLTPREAAQTYGTLNMLCSGEREEEEERLRERRIRQTIRERVEEQKSVCLVLYGFRDSVNRGGWPTSTSSRPRASSSLSPSPPLLLLLSNRIPAYEVTHLEVGVVVVLYDHRGTLQALLSQAERALGGQRAQRLGVLAPGGTEEITLLQGYKVTEKSVLTPDYREFWEKLCGWVVLPEEGGGVDIFCPLAASGVLLVQSLSNLTGLEVSAPTGMATGCFQNILSEWSCNSGDWTGVSSVCASPPAQRYVCEGVLQGWSWQTQWLEEALGALRDHLGPQLPRLSLDTRGRVLGTKNTHTHTHTPKVSFCGTLVLEQLKEVSSEWRGVVVRELYISECVYVRRLESVMRVYHDPLLSALQSNRAILSSAHINMVLTPVAHILDINRLFLSELGSRLQQWEADQCVADVCVKFCSKLRVYTNYLNNYPTALLTIDKGKMYPAFRAFLKRQDRTLETHMLSLQELLLCPVWRMEEYVTLLQALSLHTVSQHSDHTQLSGVLDKLTHYRDFIRKVEHKHKHLQVRCLHCVSACDRMYEHVSDVGLFLFNDAMVLTERNVCHRPFTHTHCDTHTFLASVALHSLTLREITDTISNIKYILICLTLFLVTT